MTFCTYLKIFSSAKDQNLCLIRTFDLLHLSSGSYVRMRTINHAKSLHHLIGYDLYTERRELSDIATQICVRVSHSLCLSSHEVPRAAMTKDATEPASPPVQENEGGGGQGEMFREEELKGLDPKLRALVKRNSRPGPFGLKTRLVWYNIVLMLVLHVLWAYGAVAGLRARWQSYVWYVFLGVASAFGVTAGAHRLWTHRSYKAVLPYRFMLMCFNCMAMQNNILIWTRDHRLHHKYAETDADPHNVHRGFFFAHVGWLLMLKHPQVIIKGRNIDVSDLEQDPVVRFQARHYLKLCLIFSLLVPSLVPWYFWNEDPWISFAFLFAFRYITSLHCTWLVNSAAHLWGERPYDSHSNPADNHFVCYAAVGEGYHNYHHAFPYDYSTGEWGPKLNMTTCFIDICAALGLVYDRKLVSQEAILRMRQRKGDLSN